MAARLLLIEDDELIARFVGLALEDLPPDGQGGPGVDITVAPRLSSAREALDAGGWDLIVSDLMLPDGSAEILLTEGAAQRPGAPPWVVFSAGLTVPKREFLQRLGVARLLGKPVPLADLLATVSSLLGAAQAGVPPAPPDVDPVARHFGGDRALYETFRAGCIERFADDLAQGDSACARADAPALQRVAHGLKAVLELIGHPALAAQARTLESAAAACAPGQALPSGWDALALGARRD
jgi:DNA-binding response OmpR family regulator